MAEVRLNSEKKLETKDFRLKIGTTNKNNPQVIYVEGRTFVSPLDNKEDYSRDILDFQHTLKSAISNGLANNRHFEKKFIVDFQLASKGICYNKKSFLSFQFLLKQNPENVMKFKDAKEKAMPLVDNVITKLGNSIEEHDFKITKTKR